MTRGLVVLDSNAVRRLIKAVNCDLDLLIHLGDWLSHLGLFSDAQIYGILAFVKSGICEFDRLTQGGKVTAASLVVTESRWVAFTGHSRFLDTQTSEEVDSMPICGVTHIVCDVAALWARMHYRQDRHADRTVTATTELTG